MNRKKLIIGLVLVVVLGAIAYANLNFTRSTGVEVNIETVALRDLEAVVSASGKIRPKKSVNISADTMGKVVDLAVNEGDIVTAGQFLLQIDPRNLQIFFSFYFAMTGMHALHMIIGIGLMFWLLKLAPLHERHGTKSIVRPRHAG